MEEKKTTAAVTVTVETCNGNRSTISGDTAIVFMTSNAMKAMRGEVEGLDGTAAYVGKEIPAPIFPETMGAHICQIVKEQFGKENPMEEGYILYAIAEFLNKESKRVCDDVSKEDMRKYAEAHIGKIFDALFDKG